MRCNIESSKSTTAGYRGTDVEGGDISQTLLFCSRLLFKTSCKLYPEAWCRSVLSDRNTLSHRRIHQTTVWVRQTIQEKALERLKMSDKKRKQNYVDTKVQGALLRRIISHWFVFFFVAGITIVAMQALLGDPAQSISERVAAKASDLGIIGIVLLAIFPAFLLDTIRFSNRFAGPVVRLRRGLRELGENGTTTDITFRDDDFWADMAAEFNLVKARVDAANNEQPVVETVAPVQTPVASAVSVPTEVTSPTTNA